jgi:hypothetical protein
MEGFNSLFNKQHIGELILVILFIIYLIMGYNTPEPIANLVDSLVGRVIIFIIVIYLFNNFNPILGVLSLFVAFELLRRSSVTTGIDALQRFAPTEERKMSQFTAFNQFPYTLEQEIVAKMAPLVQSGSCISQAPFKPLLDNLHGATPINNSN